MTIRVQCDCGASFKTKPALVDRVVKCPKCQGDLAIIAPIDTAINVVESASFEGMPEFAELTTPVKSAPVHVPRPTASDQNAPVHAFASKPSTLNSADRALLAAGADLGPVKKSFTGPKWGPTCISIYGLVLMWSAGIIGATNVLGGIWIVVRIINSAKPETVLQETFVSMLFIGLVAFQTLWWIMLLRIGIGLVNNERTAVHGLAVIAALYIGLGYWLMDSHQTIGIAVMAIFSLLLLPPTVIGYLCYGQFEEVQ